MAAVKWCRGVGPFQALCEREGNHEGRHEGHEANGYMYYWDEMDYPTPRMSNPNIPEVTDGA